MKYLIIKCNELSDQYECDADRTPVCITEDKEKYWYSGYEIYSIKKDGTLELIKEYDESGEEGMAIYYWLEFDEDPEKDAPHILEKFPNESRDDWSIERVTKYAKKYNLKEKTEFINSYKDMYKDIRSCGCYSDVVNDKYLCIGEYTDDYFNTGY